MTDTTAPETIFLQVVDESENYQDEKENAGFYEGVTWCADKINEKDVEYVRADLAIKKPQAVEDLKEFNKQCNFEMMRVALEDTFDQ